MVLEDEELIKILKAQESNEFADTDKQREKFIVSQMSSKKVMEDKQISEIKQSVLLNSQEIRQVLQTQNELIDEISQGHVTN